MRSYVLPPKCPECLHRVVTTLFSRQQDGAGVIEVGINEETIPTVTTEELRTASKELGNKYRVNMLSRLVQRSF